MGRNGDAETVHIFTSHCSATNRPAPPFAGLAALRRPTSQPCPRSHTPNIWETSATALVQAGPAPSRHNLDLLLKAGQLPPSPVKNWI
ncbi:hypothetical protein Cadr_000028091 [Camelus dromedarius]|uniref:Uncharacterized protein n=1 Tax=Camelus dromedarius TaxID=9838 RepID=A0A5N4CAA8_CAMDR|nr:hypothetical protein Cadr_000028091 [Camelus dromedarius]